MNQTAVILANGDFPARPENLKLLRNAGTVICCDGAAAKMHQSGREPDVIIGDLDSFPEELRQRYQDRIIHVSEQETNDLSKAFRYACTQNFSEIVILGATGEREDHSLGNISLLPDFAAVFPNIRMITDHGCFRALLRSGTMPAAPGQQISIFSFDPRMPITSSGLKYPLDSLRLTRWWQATLNEAMDTEFRLDFPGPSPLLVFFNNMI